MILEVFDDLFWKVLENGFKCISNIDEISNCNFYVVVVLIFVDLNNCFDFIFLIGVSIIVGKVILKGDIVVYEFIVYLGVIEEECFLVVEEVFGLIYNVDFYVGYLLECINLGDKEYIVEKIKKVIFGLIFEIVDIVDFVYNLVLVNGIYKVFFIKVVEVFKIIENF